MFWKKRTYLDYAAGGSGNPSSPHEEGRALKSQLEDARTSIARTLEVQPDDVIFTSGATEANAIALLGYVRAIRRHRRNNAHVLYLPSAHSSIVENVRLLAEEGVIIEKLPVKDARVDIERLSRMITVNTVLVTMDAVCGETGVVWNTREVASVLRSRAERPLLHVDASQAPMTEKATRAHFDADMLTFDLSKVSSSRGMGILVAHRTIPILPLYRGGGQERGVRPGTEVPGLAQEFARALTVAASGRDAFRTSALQRRTQLVSELTTAIPEVLINEGKAQAPHILNISLPGRDTDFLVALLDEEGFAVSTRSACETDSEEGSRAVYALTGDEARAKSTLRISWGVTVRKSEFSRLVRALVKSLTLC